MKLEIVAVGAQGAAVAAEEGADRIELCSALELGGLTPSQGLMEAAQEAADGRLEIHPLIRSRPGDFLYSDADLDTMDREIRFLLGQGAHGVVIGVLTAAGDIDVQATRKLADAALETNPNAQLTFHRAIDQTPDPAAAVEQLVELGFTRVLSSGGAATVGAGIETLERMVQRAAGRLEVMAGGGLALDDIPALHATGLSAVHLSAKATVSTRKDRAAELGSPDASDPTAYMVTNRDLVRAARAVSR
ncbi:copper homeostasis protein CutC [Arthrobacter bambusae]|uniref:PF03932 family protein CutC n=1 Tax=Arthrobacter bambusae TaxID=1338426 RepID=A0AAW8DAI8_9MICC|nr:copper homeostasis protein CutC [Arthrobacter bambusae]MDP9905921.1 copper homeostasis protein [Arthrobacter bambusae]MDQ0130152.1 copper homeostasis protein [Arthrobacter bambusae]MDQ0181532.1 copper homeostasis protein [Arthrobacter bambusae]